MILCCGEALIDMIPAPTTDGPQGFVPHAGGAVFNTAIALGRLGAAVGLLTGLSTDMFGVQLAEALAQSQVHSRLCVRSGRPTTLAFVRLVDGQASYDFYDENSAGRMLVPADMPALPADVTALYFGGISLACEPAAEAYAALLAREGAGRAVMLDPNIRPGFIQNADSYRARLNAMMARADIVKVSDEDLDWIVPGTGSVAQKVATLQETGPAVVIVTQGAEGATGFLRDGNRVQVPAARAVVVDTVGAGDTFNAGVLAQLAQSGHLTKAALATCPPAIVEKALAYGARVAAVTVSRAGAVPPWADEL